MSNNDAMNSEIRFLEEVEEKTEDTHYRDQRIVS